MAAKDDFFQALKENDLDAARRIWIDNDLSANIRAGGRDDTQSRSALEYAVSLGPVDDYRFARELIADGANVNARGESGITPLFLAKDAKGVEVLAEAHADLNAATTAEWGALPAGATALHHAARSVGRDVFEALSTAGADKDIRDADDRTALHYSGDYSGLPRVQVGPDQDGWVNQNAQANRDLADKMGLTSAIEGLFAEGKTGAEVQAALADRLNGIAPEDQAQFVVGVRATLGIPSRGTAEGIAEFDEWKAARDERLKLGVDGSREAGAEKPAPAPAGERKEPSLGGAANMLEQGVDAKFIADLDARMEKAELQELGWRGRDDLDDILQDLEVLAGQDWQAAAELWDKYLPGDKDKPSFIETQDRSDEDRSTRDAGGGDDRDQDAKLRKDPDALDALRKRYLETDNKFYFRDSQELAFEDKGSRMKTKTDDPEVAKSMVELADSKGWNSLKVKGTDDFKRAVWLEASLRGMEVKGYKPRDVDIAKLAELKADREKEGNYIERVQTRDKGRSTGADRAESASDREPVDEQTSVLSEKQRAAINTLKSILRDRGDSEKAITMAADMAAERFNTDRVYVGRVLEHGPAPYEFDKDKADNYFVKIQSPQGEKTIWGVDLERAIAENGVKVGDDVALAYQGRVPVTVPTKEIGADGKPTGRMTEITTNRNTWDVNQLDKLRDEVREILADKAAKTDRQQPLVKVFDRDAPRAVQRIVQAQEPARDQERARG